MLEFRALDRDEVALQMALQILGSDHIATSRDSVSAREEGSRARKHKGKSSGTGHRAQGHGTQGHKAHTCGVKTYGAQKSDAKARDAGSLALLRP